MSLFEIRCPECKAKIWIDLASGKIVDHQKADHQKADFNQFLKSRGKGPAWDDRFQKAKDEEARRKAEIENKFKKAREEGLAEEDDGTNPMKSPFDWD